MFWIVGKSSKPSGRGVEFTSPSVAFFFVSVVIFWCASSSTSSASLQSISYSDNRGSSSEFSRDVEPLRVCVSMLRRRTRLQKILTAQAAAHAARSSPAAARGRPRHCLDELPELPTPESESHWACPVRMPNVPCTPEKPQTRPPCRVPGSVCAPPPAHLPRRPRVRACISLAPAENKGALARTHTALEEPQDVHRIARLARHLAHVPLSLQARVDWGGRQ